MSRVAGRCGDGYSGTSSVADKVELSSGKGWASGRREEPVLVLGCWPEWVCHTSGRRWGLLQSCTCVRLGSMTDRVLLGLCSLLPFPTGVFTPDSEEST